MTHDLPGAEEHCLAGLSIARRSGAREDEALAASNLIYILTMAGRIDEAIRLASDLIKNGGDERPGAGELHLRLSHVRRSKGELEAAREHLSLCHGFSQSDDLQHRSCTQQARRLSRGRRETTDAPLKRRAGRSTRRCAGTSTSLTRRSDVPSRMRSTRRSTRAIPRKPSGSTAMFAAWHRERSRRSYGHRSLRARALLAAREGTTTRRGGPHRCRGELAGPRLSVLDGASTARPGGVARRPGPTGRSRRIAGEAAKTFERLGTTPMLVRAQAVSRATAEVR